MDAESPSSIITDPDVINSLRFSIQLKNPITKAGVLNYKESFGKSFNTTESKELLQTLHTSRINLENSVNSKALIWNEIVDAVDAYLPSLLTLTWSLTQCKTPLRIAKTTQFGWQGCYSIHEISHKYDSFVEFAFEIVMTLHTLAVGHVAKANMALNDTLDFVNAGKFYLSASSIMEFISSNILHRWIAKGAPTHRPLEAQQCVCNAMSQYYQACAQKCAVLKAVHAPTPAAPGTLAKLCVAVANLCESSLSNLDALSQLQMKVLNPLITTEIRYSKEVYMALVYYHEGLSHISKEQYGIGIAYYRLAQSSLKNASDVCSGSFSACSTGIKKLLTVVQRTTATAEKDNNGIYFLPIPGSNDMPPLPEKALIMMKKAYVDPSGGTFVKFEYDELSISESKTTVVDPQPSTSSSDFTSLMNTLTLNTTANTDTDTVNKYTVTSSTRSLAEAKDVSVASNTTMHRSDSDLARDLQAKWNSGEDV